MPGTWHDLVGPVAYVAGTSGTVTIPAGAVVIAIVAHASAGGAAMTLFAGPSVPVPSGEALSLHFLHTLWQSRNNTAAAGSQDIVFTGTDQYFVEYVARG